MTAKERLKLLTERQDRLAKQVKGAQEALYKLLLESLDKIETNPAYVEQVFTAFNKSEGVQLVTTLAQDMGSIATANYSYFLAFKDELDLSQKDFGAIKKTVDSFLQERIGLSGNKVIKDSFLDSVLTDPTVKQKVKQQAYANLMNGEGATAFRKNLKATVLGEQGKLGALEAHYNTFVYDTYNQVDSALQVQYADELQLEAFVYEGGVISTTRSFCRKYNGKIVLRSEALKNWPNELTTGKPKSYNPLSDRGGYSCRHSLNFVSARRAMRMRDDLELDSNGKLRVKGTGNSNEFTPAKTIQEAEEYTKQTGLFSEKSDFSGFTLDEANDINRAVFNFKDKLNPAFEFEQLERLYVNKDLHVSARIEGNQIALNPDSMRSIKGGTVDDMDRLKKRIDRKQRTLDEYDLPASEKELLQNSIKEWQKELEDLKNIKAFQVDSIEGIITHELGHTVQYNLLENPKNWSKIDDFADSKYRAKHNIDFKSQLQAKLDSIAYKEGIKISQYAAKNAEEYFAESWTAFMKNSAEAKLIHPDLLNIFKQITR